MRKWGTCLLVFCLLTGCGGYRYNFVTGLPPNESSRVQKITHQGFYGHLSGASMNLGEVCPEGVAAFGSRISFLNWVPSVLTMGLYTPRTMHAVCAAKEGTAQ